MFEEVNDENLPIEYISGDSLAFVTHIKSLGDKAILSNVDGHFRWVVTREDGTRYIARPEEAKPNE